MHISWFLFSFLHNLVPTVFPSSYIMCQHFRKYSSNSVCKKWKWKFLSYFQGLTLRGRCTDTKRAWLYTMHNTCIYLWYDKLFSMPSSSCPFSFLLVTSHNIIFIKIKVNRRKKERLRDKNKTLHYATKQ